MPCHCVNDSRNTRQMEARVAAGVNYFIFYIGRIAYEQEPFQILTEQVLPRFQ